jgi:hypothetical protein
MSPNTGAMVRKVLVIKAMSIIGEALSCCCIQLGRRGEGHGADLVC